MTNHVQSTVFDSLFSAAGNLGFQYTSFVSTSGKDGFVHGDGFNVLANNFSDRWNQRYMDQAYYEIDPVIRQVPSGILSRDWNELLAMRKEFFTDAAGFGLKSGVAVPIHASNRHYVMCFASEHDGEVTPETRSHLEGLAFVAFQNWYRSRIPSPGEYGLSEKTLLILKMMGTERTTQQIANDLGMTKDGVAWHLKTARHKLGCKKTMQAYGKALSLGLFETLYHGKKKRF